MYPWVEVVDETDTSFAYNRHFLKDIVIKIHVNASLNKKKDSFLHRPHLRVVLFFYFLNSPAGARDMVPSGHRVGDPRYRNKKNKKKKRQPFIVFRELEALNKAQVMVG